MKVRVTITETQQTFLTYEIDGVNDFETAAKCAQRAYKREYQPNAYLYRKAPMPRTYTLDKYEIVDAS